MTVNPAVRVMKARRSGRVGCGCWVQRGQHIARVDGKWVCGGCVIEHWRRLQQEPPKPGRAGITTEETT